MIQENIQTFNKMHVHSVLRVNIVTDWEQLKLKWKPKIAQQEHSVVRMTEVETL